MHAFKDEKQLYFSRLLVLQFCIDTFVSSEVEIINMKLMNPSKIEYLGQGI